MEPNKNSRQNSSQSSSNLSLTELSFFNGNEYSTFVYKKTEKLVTALYLISNFFPESEPLKWSLRDKGLCLLNYSLSFANLGVSDREMMTTKFFSVVLEVLSMLEVAFIGGLISSMNHTILSREYHSLINFIQTKEENEKAKSGYILSDTFFSSVEKTTQEQTNTTIDRAGIPGSALKSKNDKGQSHTHSISSNAGNGQPFDRNLDKKSTIRDLASRKDSRKNLILSVLKKGDRLTIKDFTKVISNCSEKTIQRELLQMVSDGVLKKEGERRWSTYSLA